MPIRIPFPTQSKGIVFVTLVAECSKYLQESNPLNKVLQT